MRWRLQRFHPLSSPAQSARLPLFPEGAGKALRKPERELFVLRPLRAAPQHCLVRHAVS